MTARPRLLAAAAAGAALAAGAIGVLILAPEPAVAAAPISTITPAAAAPALAGPAANITAAHTAGQRAAELVAERDAAAREPALTCEPTADARLVGDVIVNKNCPDLNSAREAAQRDYPTSGDAQRDWGCQQGYITDGCGGVNGPKPSEAEQRRRIADGSVPVGGGYAPGTDEYRTCVRNPVADVCGG